MSEELEMAVATTPIIVGSWDMAPIPSILYVQLVGHCRHHFMVDHRHPDCIFCFMWWAAESQTTLTVKNQ